MIGQQSVKIGNGVTIRDHVFTPQLDAGDGNLFGGLIVGDLMKMGRLNTVASGRIMIPTNENKVTIASPVRSLYPLNNCPYSDQMGGSTMWKIMEEGVLSPFKSIELDDNSLQVSEGTCTEWTPFDLNPKILNLELLITK